MSSRTASTLGALAFMALTGAIGWSQGAPADFLILDTTLGFLFIASGYVAWSRRPDLPTGRLLVLCGVLWFVGSYGPMPIGGALAALGFAFSGLYDLPLAYLLLTFPVERLTGVRRAALVALGLGLLGRSAGRLLLTDPPTFDPEFCGDCPHNPFGLFPSGLANVQAIASWVTDVPRSAGRPFARLVRTPNWSALAPMRQ